MLLKSWKIVLINITRGVQTLEKVKVTLNDLKEMEDWKNAVIVFTKDSFDREYSELERSYKISRENKYFMPMMNSYSLFGSCLDGKDSGVRLDIYMNINQGKRWKEEYCYIID
jgi:hypothetical protein